MRPPIVQSQWKGFRVESLTPDHILDIRPEPGYPHGREAKALSDLWLQLRDTHIQGLLLLGCDIAADPDDLLTMTHAAEGHPDYVHTGLVKLWPQSTGRDDWIWSHRGGRPGAPEASQFDPSPIAYVSLGFLWVPARLLDLAFPAGEGWHWGELDVRLSELAYTNLIPMWPVNTCRPKHLHFTPAHED